MNILTITDPITFDMTLQFVTSSQFPLPSKRLPLSDPSPLSLLRGWLQVSMVAIKGRTLAKDSFFVSNGKKIEVA